MLISLLNEGAALRLRVFGRQKYLRTLFWFRYTYIYSFFLFMVNDPGLLFFDSDVKLTFSVNASKLKSESMQRKTLGKDLSGTEYISPHLLAM